MTFWRLSILTLGFNAFKKPNVMSVNQSKPVPQHAGTPKHLRTPEFVAYIREKSRKGGQSRSLAKLDAARRNGAKAGGKKRGPRGPQMMVPPLNAPEVACVAGCGFTMLLSQRAMELNTRGRPITLTCPQCGTFGTVLAARSCGAPIMPPRPAAPSPDAAA